MDDDGEGTHPVQGADAVQADVQEGVGVLGGGGRVSQDLQSAVAREATPGSSTRFQVGLSRGAKGRVRRRPRVCQGACGSPAFPSTWRESC